MVRGQRNGSDRRLFEKANQRLKNIDGGDGVRFKHLGNRGIKESLLESLAGTGWKLDRCGSLLDLATLKVP